MKVVMSQGALDKLSQSLFKTTHQSDGGKIERS